jgi:O-antigen ligase
MWKAIGYVTAILGVVGVVSSIARGAMLSLCATAFAVWLRSPRKMRTLAIGVLGVMVAIVAAMVIFPSGEYWEEMSTISGGSESGTGQGRLVLWRLAMGGYFDNPVLGVGASNCGVWLANNVEFDGARTQFRDPNHMYNFALHNDYVTILCEEGSVGAIAFVAMIVDFLRRLYFLRSKAAVRAWRMAMGRTFDLRDLSLGLEAALVAYLTNAFFYNQLYVHWIWSLVTFGVALEVIVRALIARSRHHRSRTA